MADEPYNISINSKVQLSELKELLNELELINSELAKLNYASFSTLTDSAKTFAGVGKEVSGAISAQKAALDSLPKAADKAADSLKKTGNSAEEAEYKVKRSEQVIQGFFVEIGAQASRFAMQLPAALSSSIKAFGQQELATQKLAAAIKAQGGSVSEVLPVMQELASAIQQVTTYGDEQVMGMQSMAASMGVTADQMDGVIKTAIGLSTALGMDVTTATKAAAAAVQGKTGMLMEYIPSLIKCKTEEEKLAKVQELSQSGFSQAEAAAKTLEGKLQQAANAWGDLSEVVGGTFAPLIKGVAGLLTGVCQTLAENEIMAKAFTAGLTSLAVGLAFSKVGGLLNVAKMFLGVASGVKTATTATHAFNLAIKANPIGLIASAATFAILALTNLASTEDEEAEAQDAATIKRQKAAEETKKASEIINEYEESLKAESATAAELAQKTAALADEIAALENSRGEWAEGAQISNAEKLVQKKKELVKLQAEYLKSVVDTANAELQGASDDLGTTKYWLEMELNKAREAGLSQVAKFREAELKNVALQQEKIEIQKKYISDNRHLVQTEEDMKRIQSEALEYANMAVAQKENERKLSEAQAAAAKSYTDEQKRLELEILQAQASGNTAQTEKLQKELRISQIASEIFEYSRKENMSAKELAALKDKATQQASERYELEKSVTDEVQRQNLAKNAQAQIEDILITREIERLKAAGKYTEAKQVEQERDIRRTLAGMEGLSGDSKKEVEKALRDTYAYRDKQQKRSGGLTGGYSAAGSSAVGDAVAQKNAMRGGQGPTPPAAPRGTRRNSAPSRRQGETWEEANARYDAEQAQKAEQKAERAKERDRLNSMSPGERLRASLSSSRDNVNARGLVNQMGATASRLAGTVSAEPRSAPKPAGSAAAGQQPGAASSDPLAKALGDKGVEQETPFQKNLAETLKTISEKLEKGNEDLASIKSSTDALALKKN